MTETSFFVILGIAESKANSRQIVTIGGKPRSIKSAKARSFAETAGMQIPKLAKPFTQPVEVAVMVFYPDQRRDLDISLVLDAMQGRVLVNDRQVRQFHAFHAIDKENPRVEVCVRPIARARGPETIRRIHAHWVCDAFDAEQRTAEV